MLLFSGKTGLFGDLSASRKLHFDGMVVRSDSILVWSGLLEPGTEAHFKQWPPVVSTEILTRLILKIPLRVLSWVYAVLPNLTHQQMHVIDFVCLLKILLIYWADMLFAVCFPLRLEEIFLRPVCCLAFDFHESYLCSPKPYLHPASFNPEHHPTWCHLACQLLSHLSSWYIAVLKGLWYLWFGNSLHVVLKGDQG